MAVITPPFVQQGGSHPAATFRQMLMGATGSPTGSFAGGVEPTTGGGGHGVWSATDLVATQNGTPNMSVNVAAGGCFVRGTEAAAQGVYSAFNDATLNVVIAASDPTNPRRDLLVMRVRDAFYSGASTDVALAIVTGTPAAAPVDPTVPANCLVIARISVGAAVTTIVNANITSLTPRASSLGGLMPCLSTKRPTGAALFASLQIFELDTSRILVYDGAGWIVLAEPAQAHTPTLTGITLGNGSLAFAYRRHDGWCDLYGRFTLGSTSVITGQMGFSLPIAANASPSSLNGSILIQDTGTALYSAFGYLTTTSRLDIYANNAAGTYVALTATSATVPHAWANTDVIDVALSFRMATRYS